MYHLKMKFLLGTLISLALLLFIAGDALGVAATTPFKTTGKANCGGWNIFTSPNSGTLSNAFYAVSADSATDVWAVGNFTNGGGTQTLVEQWNGSAWNIVSSPDPGAVANNLYGVAALAANNVWAVGDLTSGNFQTQPLIENWNGTTWSVIQGPMPPSNPSLLYAVAAVSANDIWAVGSYLSGKYQQTLTEHWNGSTWSIITSPNVGQYTNVLHGISAVASNDVWAVGYRYDKTGNIFTLIEHWNGTSWSISSPPKHGNTSGDLLSVAAIATNDIWAVGDFPNSIQQETLTEHWNGSRWNVVTSPNPSGSLRSVLNGVTAISSNNIWAVGTYNDGTATQTLTEQWNGSWSIVPSPNTSASESFLAGVATAPGTNSLWSVGDFVNSGYKENTLTAYYC